MTFFGKAACKNTEPSGGMTYLACRYQQSRGKFQATYEHN